MAGLFLRIITSCYFCNARNRCQKMHLISARFQIYWAIGGPIWHWLGVEFLALITYLLSLSLMGYSFLPMRDQKKNHSCSVVLVSYPESLLSILWWPFKDKPTSLWHFTRRPVGFGFCPGPLLSDRGSGVFLLTDAVTYGWHFQHASPRKNI